MYKFIYERGLYPAPTHLHLGLIHSDRSNALFFLLTLGIAVSITVMMLSRSR
jgi:hypothetical protein